MPAKRDCVKAVRAAMKEGELSEAAAEKLLADMTRRAQQRATLKGISIDKAVKEIAGEMAKTEQTMKALDKRNKLLTIQKTRFVQQFAERFPVWAKGLAAFEVGSSATSTTGAGGMIDPQWTGLNARYMGRLYAELEASGALNDFKHGNFSREFFHESAALHTGKRPTVQNESAYKIAKLWAELRKELVARLNRAGAFIGDIPDYVIMQTHQVERVRAEGGKGFGPEHKERAFAAWEAFTLDRLDHEKTFEGENPSLSMRAIHDALYSGKHENAPREDFSVKEYRTHGTLANKISSGRVLWFKDAQAAWEYNQRYGDKDYHSAIRTFVRNATRNIALMENLGPNPELTLKQVIRNLTLKAKDTGDAKQEDALTKYEPRLMGYYRLISGQSNVSVNPTLTKWAHWASAVAVSSKLGSVLFSALGDKAFFQTAMAYNGISHLDALVKQLTLFVKNSPDSKKAARQLGIVPQSFIGGLHERLGLEQQAHRQVDGWLTRFMDMTGLNLWTDLHEHAAANLLAHNIGDAADRAWGALPHEIRRGFEHYGLTPKEWEAARKTVWAAADGERFVTSDRFEQITDAQWTAIATEQGLTPSPANKKRVRDQLESKYQAFIIDQVHTAVPKPGAAERYITSLGAQQAGTVLGEGARLAMLFKSFPITVMRKVIGREVYGRGSDTIGHWLANDHKGKFNLAMLIAMSTVAGYFANTLRDLARGRTPRDLIDDDGEINWDVLKAAALRGGGAGILGDFMFSEYDRGYKHFLSAAAGPVFGQLDPIVALISKTRKLGDDDAGITPESIGAESMNLILNNTPLINLFYVRPVLDYFIFWNMQEMLSPGMLRRRERSIRNKNHQDFFIVPSDIANIPISEPGAKIGALTE